MSSSWGALFDGTAAIDAGVTGGAGVAPGVEVLEAFLKSVPARWAVYLLADEADRPVQLLCVKNLRQSLRRRLGEQAPEAGPSKRADLRGLVRRVYWRRVDSRLEADLVYLEAARAVFPAAYKATIANRPAWFVHVDPGARFPRYVRTTDLSTPGGVLLGPIEEKGVASKLIELVESAFDLCRYHNVLTEAPNGRACAYKEMGRCPAPCDGSVELEQYRRMVELSTRTLVDPADAVRQHEARMRQAASELKFEVAAKIKQYVDELSVFARGPYRHVRPLEEFAFVSLQCGPREGTAKVFLITPGAVTEELCLLSEPLSGGGQILRLLLEHAESRRTHTTDEIGAERIGVVTGHLFATKNTSGVFVPLAELEDRGFARAYRELMKQTAKALPEEPTPDSNIPQEEGVLRELGSGLA